MSFGAWFEQNPGPYFPIANAVLIGFVALALWRPTPSRLTPVQYDRLFAVAAMFTLFIWRWPILICPNPLNPDEGEMIANALKATTDIVPWRGFDGTTSGPLNSDILLLAAAVGAHLDFFSARVIGLLLMGGAICALFWAIAWQFNGEIARVCAAPLVVFLALTRNPDFIHYSSEHLPIFLTTVALACAVYLSYRHASDRTRLATAAIGGLCVGCTPFAKLQATPMAVLLFLYLLAAIWTSRDAVRERFPAAIGAVVAGALAPAVVILGSVALAGEWNDFLISYLLFAASYVQNSSDSITPAFYFNSALDYRSFAYSAITIFACCALAMRGFTGKRSVGLSLAPVTAPLLLLVTFFTIYEAHHGFTHYLLFSLVPVTWLLANVFGPIYLRTPLSHYRNALRVAYVFAFAIPALSNVTGTLDLFVKDMPSSGTYPKNAIAVAIGQYVPRGGEIEVWGWMPEYYVESGTIMATRDAHTYHQITPGPYQAYFRDRFMTDIRASRPALILDAVCPGSFGFSDNASQGIRSFPQLAVLVRNDYTLVGVVNGVSFYRRRPDR